MSDTNYQELKRVEPIVCADSILNVAFERIDPGVMLEFAGDFGLMPRSAEGDTHFLRGPRPGPLPRVG
jgi:hypothetical protein